MKRYLILFFLIFLVSISCQSPKSTPEQTVIDNFKAMDEENISKYMKTVTGPRAGIADTLLKELFRDYDVSYTVEDIKLLSVVDEIAQVKTVVVAKDEGGPKKYRDNRMVFLHKLRKEHGKWLISFSEVLEMEIFDKTQPDTTLIARDTSQ